MKSDPDGTLILDRYTFDKIELGMDSEVAIGIIGSPPYQGQNTRYLEWLTLCGSKLNLTLSEDRSKKVTDKCLYDFIAKAAGMEPATKSGRRRTKLQWPAISSEKCAKYFLKHATPKQRLWFQTAMSAGVGFGMVKNFGTPSLQPIFDRSEPAFLTTDRITVRNKFSDDQVDNLWKSIVQVGSSQAMVIRNRLMVAASWTGFCTEKETETLLDLLQHGDYINAEQLVVDVRASRRSEKISIITAKLKEWEQGHSFDKREYKKKEYTEVWNWYRELIYERDENRCQHCGTSNDEHENPLYHLDHICPISRGGRTELSNLQLLCETCNLVKGQKSEDDFPREIQSRWYKNRER
ncbi:MAG: HNH endonuclease [Pirellulaceae bacterium]